MSERHLTALVVVVIAFGAYATMLLMAAETRAHEKAMAERGYCRALYDRERWVPCDQIHGIRVVPLEPR